MVTTKEQYIKGKEGEFCTKYSPHSYMMALVDIGWEIHDAEITSKFYADTVFIPTIERHRWLNKRKELSDVVKG